jgi:hypothetical protein
MVHTQSGHQNLPRRNVSKFKKLHSCFTIFHDFKILFRFPLENSGQEYNGISTAIKIAEKEFEKETRFSNYTFEISKFNTECQSDKVLNKFIHLFSKRKHLLGVLGPSCSSAVEPIAAISKHYQLSVITYSAEGIILERENFPYFYRTIGKSCRRLLTSSSAIFDLFATHTKMAQLKSIKFKHADVIFLLFLCSTHRLESAVSSWHAPIKLFTLTLYKLASRRDKFNRI